jgi:uncharacterized glyoxalase superfamily protein PhnB
MDDDKIISLFGEDQGVKMDAAARRRILSHVSGEYDAAKPHRMPGADASYMPPRPAGALRTVFMTVIACMAVLAIGWQQGHVRFGQDDAAREKVILAEFNELFGGRVQAVINAGGQTQIVLAEQGTVLQGQPVVIRFTDKGRDVEVMSYSGQTVQVSLGGRDVVFETLVSGDGRVILAGEKVFWDGSRGEIADAPGVKIKTGLLEM